ncbi:MAG: alpha-amylase family glycosyl hydrolase [Janthinobacterium lividum]
MSAGALFAMGLIDELSHALVARYRRETDPEVLTEALRWFGAKAGTAEVDTLLLTFTERFPNAEIYAGKMTAAEWLKGSTEGLSNREAAFEELTLLYLANANPAFLPFRELFDDKGLTETTAYKNVVAELPKYFATRPPVAPEIGSLLDALEAPMRLSPDSITAQLDYIREQWSEFVDADLKQILLAIDTVKEEDIAIWMRFNPPAPDVYRHGAPGFGGEGFQGDEYVGFEDSWETGSDGVRRRVAGRRYGTDYQAPLNEYEAFSADQAWMPTVVMMAKSTYVWLEQLSRKYGRHIHKLDQIPDEELQLMADRGMTALWLIGLWERSVASQRIKHLRGQGDAVASAYSLKEYNIAEDLGGNAAYESLRDRAGRVGLRLASDMVPNHMGIDSPWVVEHPEWFVYRWESPYPAYTFNGPDLSADSRVEIKLDDHYYDQTDAAVAFRVRYNASGETRYIYHGNDGTTFAWNDTAQLDYSKAFVREQVMQTILHVARMFPIIRFDAAMVLAKRHVQRLWFPLPGVGGSIPSRAEDAMTDEEFNAIMPAEFWREVVDRVALEVPGTLLLAEAFWMLEGYFVRTLGMHRVYNSAFMNMLRDEENAKYRSYLKKTIEFDPDILKRYVNFMSNPDERTTVDQFGSGDKCFGVATLMATLPGLPMFGHGQIEGYTERYGMEFKKPKMTESPDEHLVARHNAEIAPLLKKRYIFAESENFILYDFWMGDGTVNENVFAYSNRNGHERSVILYNNAFTGTNGTIKVSAASMDKGSGELRQRTLEQGLALPHDDAIVTFRDHARGLEYLRRSSDLRDNGLTMELRGYQYAVLLHWKDLRSTAEQPWDRLCDALNGQGVPSIDQALAKLRFQPLHAALRRLLCREEIEAFSSASQAALAQAATVVTARPEPPASASLNGQGPVVLKSGRKKGSKTASAEKAPIASAAPLKEESENADSAAKIGYSAEAADRFLERANEFYWRMTEVLPEAQFEQLGDDLQQGAKAYWERLQQFIQAAVAIPGVARGFSTAWPPAVAEVVPGAGVGAPIERTWTPLLAYVLLRALPGTTDVQVIFDELDLRAALAESFAELGIEGDDVWRLAAKLRLLLAGRTPLDALHTETFWSEGDVRWLTGLNEGKGVMYVNKESFEQLLCFLALPAILGIAGHLGGDDAYQKPATELAEIEGSLRAECTRMNEAGYKLRVYLGDEMEAEPAAVEGDADAVGLR